MTVPPRPAVFAPDVAPPGVDVRLVSFADDRRLFKASPKLQLAHTNGASTAGSVASSIRHAEAAPNVNTVPHFQVDLDGSAGMLLTLDRVGIANATMQPSHKDWMTLPDAVRADLLAHPGSVQNWSLATETADTGYIADPTISAFTDAQVETVAIIFAYCAVLYPSIPLTTPTEWHGSGTGSHTDPFGYPYWTIQRGKICPGLKKKAQVRGVILPRAREIYAAWTDTDQEDDMTKEEHDALMAVHDALLVNDPTDGTAPIVSKVNQTHTIMKVLWDGFPGTIVDAAGSLARTIKRLGTKAGVKTD